MSGTFFVVRWYCLLALYAMNLAVAAFAVFISWEGRRLGVRKSTRAVAEPTTLPKIFRPVRAPGLQLIQKKILLLECKIFAI